MRKKNSPKDFQVAILVEDISEAKKISDGLRDIGIFAHFYQNLDELWVSLNTYTPDFCIVDVKKMSHGTLLFKNHQKVKNHSLKYAFYYSDATKVLVNSTYGLNHYGYIRAELDLVSQFKNILMRRNEELRLLEQVDSFDARVKRLKLRSQRMVEQQERNQQVLNNTTKVKDLIERFGTVDNEDEFFKRVLTIFADWSDCYDFGIYKLNSTKQKLISPKIRGAKYRNLPDLWLSRPCESGIENFAIDMAFDVCYGLMDTELATIKVCGGHQNPDVLIIGKFHSTLINELEWMILETKLNAEYRKALVRSTKRIEDANHIDSIHETMQVLDDIQFHRIEAKHRHALIDFSALTNMIRQRHGNRFFWKAFTSEFIDELSEQLAGDYRIAQYGVEAFIVSIDKRFIESDYHKLKAFVADFQLWKYFEDSSLIVTSDLSPEIKFIAPSSVNVMRQLKDGFTDLVRPTTPEISRRLEI